jgi:uncharacterized membrane-anchored protein YhcB (DUF1043 family)
MPNPLLVVWATVATALFVGLLIGWLFYARDGWNRWRAERQITNSQTHEFQELRSTIAELRRLIIERDNKVNDVTETALYWRNLYFREMGDEIDPSKFALPEDADNPGGDA